MRTIRPLQAEALSKHKPGTVCSCGSKLLSWAEISNHWVAGHFDYTTTEPMTRTEAMRELVDIHNTVRAQRSIFSTQRKTINQTYEKFDQVLTRLEERLNALSQEIPRLKSEGS